MAAKRAATPQNPLAIVKRSARWKSRSIEKCRRGAGAATGLVLPRAGRAGAPST